MALETIVVNDENQYDIFIIGAGPSGLSAAIYSARSGLKTCFIDKSTPGGKIVGLKNITNFPGFKNISGTELSTNLYTQAIAAGSKYIYGTVVNVVEKLGYLAVYSDDGNTWFSKSVIVCTGTENKKMEIPGESQYKDIGISYCATCDGHLTHNKMTIVIGDNDEAVSSAIYLSTLSKNITLVFEKDKIEGKISLKDLKNKGITVLLNKTPVEVFGDTYNLKGLKIRDKSNSSIEEIKADFIFVFYGYVASTDFLKDFPIMKNGVISINSDKSTKIKGLFAAGDVSKNENRQIITAVNDGAIAAMSAIAFVEKK